MVAGSSQLLLRPNDSAVDSFCQCESVLHNRRQGFGIERRPAYQRAIDFFLRHQGRSVIRLHRPAVENAQLRGELLAEYFRGFATDNGVGFPASSGVAVLPVPIAHTGS